MKKTKIEELKEEQIGFTDEETLLMNITAIIIKWEDNELMSSIAMNQIAKLNLDYLKKK